MRSAVALLALATAACGGRGGPPPPASEFLVAAGDSTFWIASGDAGIVVRGAPISLARLDGRLYELYVTDDDRSFYDAIMIGQRIYRRDLITGDSVSVLQDTTVPDLAEAYAVAHADVRPLAPHEEASPDPDIYATADLEVVGLHGPYLSYEHHSDAGFPDGSEAHSIRRGVVDLRTRARRTVSDLFGAREARRVIAAARKSFAAGVDSLMASPDAESRDIAEAMRHLRFDPTSFSIERLGDQPAVSFLIPGDGEWALELAVPMTPIRVAAPSWWMRIRESFPSATEATGDEIWERSGFGVLARGDPDREVTTIVLLDSVAQEWKAARVPAPVHRILWLDRPPLDSIARRALRRAFEEAALYSEDTRIALAPILSAPAPTFRPVSLQHRDRPHRRRPTPWRGATSRPSHNRIAARRPTPATQ
jgi:hypothetical protein